MFLNLCYIYIYLLLTLLVDCTEINHVYHGLKLCGVQPVHQIHMPTKMRRWRFRSFWRHFLQDTGHHIMAGNYCWKRNDPDQWYRYITCMWWVKRITWTWSLLFINSFGMNHQTTLHLQSRIAVHFLVILQELGRVLLMAGFRGRLQRGKHLVAAFQNQQS